MKSKKIVFLKWILVPLLFIGACSKEFITKPVQPGSQSDVSFRQTANGLLLTLNSAYAPLAGSQWMQYPLTWLCLGSYRSDDAMTGGESENDDINAHAVNDFNIFSTNDMFSTFWRTAFTGIHYANAVIVSGPGALELATTDEKLLINNYVAQAHCMRAYYYFDLVRQYGDLPMVTTITPGLRPRVSRLAVYDTIQSDLTKAASVLPKANLLAATEKGRVSSGTALALLAKVYLFRASLETTKASEYYTKAYETAKLVIASNQFSLLSSYDKVWNFTGDFSTEGIIEGGQPNKGDLTGAANYWFGVMQSPRYYYEKGTRKKTGSAYGWGFNCPTQDFVNSFEPGDPRKYWSIFVPGDSSNSGNKANARLAICFDHSNTGYYYRKYTPDDFPASENALNIKYYRYADLLLVGAEAANEINQTADALAWLELVRARARNTPPVPNHAGAGDYIVGAPVIVTTTDKTELRTIIRHERRIELGMEGHRFYDLVRWDGNGLDWNSVIETAQALVGPNYQIDDDDKSGKARVGHIVVVEPKHKLSPVPDDDIKTSSNTLSQNPGY